MQAQHPSPIENIDVASLVGPSPVSIDDIAALRGIASVREVRKLSIALDAAARAGQIRSLGRGMWSKGDLVAAPDHATAQDVIVHGFGLGAAPATFGQIKDAVSAATGRNVMRLHETFTGMVAEGLLEHRDGKDYALTPSAMVRRLPDGMTRIHESALRLVATYGPMSCGQVSMLVDVPLGVAAKALSEMLAAGLVASGKDGEGMVHYAPRDDAAYGIGPAEGRALAVMTRPVTPIEIAGLLRISRERARQLARKLVERGLAVSKPADGQWRCARYVARAGLALP